MVKKKKPSPPQYAPKQQITEYPKFARTSKVYASTITPVKSGVFIRDVPHVPSRTTPGGSTPKKDIPVYTGDSMIGISVIHKSGLSPLFNHEHIKEVANMRR